MRLSNRFHNTLPAAHQPGVGAARKWQAHTLSSEQDITDPAVMCRDRLCRAAPDGQWALMLINKDQENAHPVRSFLPGSLKLASFIFGPVT